MKIKKIIISLILCSLFSLESLLTVSADGFVPNAITAQSNAVSDNSIMNDVTSESAILVETNTKTVIADKNAYDKRPIAHLAKLMTVLITAEKIENGDISIDDKVTVSANANSKGSPQIWLDIGERISIDELLKAITVGNANDACTALGEKLGGSETKFIDMLNTRAKELGMNDTFFADVCGNDENTVSTAYDLSVLAAELLKHKCLTEYFSTWMCNVRSNAVELVSTNRLIRTYNGCNGLKSCGSQYSGECVIATAKRGNMSICCVMLGAETDDLKFSEAKSVMDYGFTSYSVYEPEINDDILQKIKIKNGEKLEASVKLDGLSAIVVPRGTSSQINCDFKREEMLEAPVKTGDKVGSVIFSNDGNEILRCNIVVDESVDKMGILYAFKKILFNLLYV